MNANPNSGLDPRFPPPVPGFDLDLDIDFDFDFHRDFDSIRSRAFRMTTREPVGSRGAFVEAGFRNPDEDAAASASLPNAREAGTWPGNEPIG